MVQTQARFATAETQADFTSSLMVYGAMVLCAAVALLRLCSGHLGHDQMLLLQDAHRWLSGEVLYGPRLSETNPPLGIWFSAVPVLLTRVLPIGVEAAFRCVMVALIALSVWWSERILRRSVLGRSRLAVALMTAGVLAVELFVAEVDFGQREHLMILCCLPWILRLAVAFDARLGLLERCALGLAATIGIWFKPQDVLVVIAVAAMVCLQRRSLRPCLSPEVLSLIFGCFAMLAAVRFAAPLYFNDTLPLLQNTYWAFGTEGALALLVAEGKFIGIALVLLAGCVLLRSRLPDGAGEAVLLAAVFAALVACVVQHTVWRYHQYPHRALFLVALFYLLIGLGLGWFERVPRARLQAVIACVSAIVCVGLWKTRHEKPVDTRPEYEALDRFFSQCAPGTPVYVFSTEVRDEATALDHNLVWSSRFAHLWMLPAIVKNESGTQTKGEPFKRLSPGVVAHLSAVQQQQLTEDLAYWRPKLVLVRHCTPEDSCQGLAGRNFATLPWFLQNQTFQREWAHYGQQPGFNGYDVYRRSE